MCADVANEDRDETCDERASELFRELQAELRRLASRQMRRQGSGHTLQTTAVVHEAFLRLGRRGRWASRAHFLASAARAMRSVLVDHHRATRREKRTPGGERVPLVVLSHPGAPPVDVLDLDAALRELEGLGDHARRAARVVEMRFFAGLTMAETATALSLTGRTVERDWHFARAWLRGRLR